MRLMLGGMGDSTYDQPTYIIPTTSSFATFNLFDGDERFSSEDLNLNEMDLSEYSIDTLFEDYTNSKPLNWNFNEELEDGGKLLNHDCMWAGHCGSKQHAEEPRSNLASLIPKPPQIIKADVMMSPPLIAPKQQSLLKPSVKAQGSVPPIPVFGRQDTPQTPPESDDEENRGNNSTLLKLLEDAINECNSDLTEYFEDNDEVEEEEIDVKEEPLYEPTYERVETIAEPQCDTHTIRNQRAAANDHSYHKNMNAVALMNNYGLDTPSDSEEEEEIDVVSVTEKAHSNANRNAFSLPTNPSRRDRQEWQKTVATAISKNGIKTILPVRSAVKQLTEPTPSTGRRGGRRAAKSPSKGAAKATAKANAKGAAKGGSKRKRKNGESQEPADKRNTHNDMERQRRVDLRYAFEGLKLQLPDVSHAKKVAKVNILLRASQFSSQLTSTSSVLRPTRIALRSERNRLKRARNALTISLKERHPTWVPVVEQIQKGMKEEKERAESG